MTDLHFEVLDVQPVTHAASPAMLFRIGIRDASRARIQSVVLQVRAQLDPRVHRYSHEERTRVHGLFGAPDQWSRSLRPLPWTQVTTVVPAFREATEVVLSVPCTYDLEVGASRYFHAMRNGEITARLLFSGSIFLTAESGLTVEPVPWDREAVTRIPARLWNEAMDACAPDRGWVCLRRETIDALLAFRDRQTLVSWDETMERLLAAAQLQQPS